MKTALLIDGDEPSSRAIKALASQLSCSLALARTASEGMVLLSEYRFPLLIAETHLPDIDGLTLVSSIRRDFPRTYCCLISPRPITRPHEAHVFLQKPLSLETLKDLLSKASAASLR
ncbi:MAG: response regulator [Candidatus Taylorbacteria bacterium]|nr:response regulator [Candidatus Taylorbacteria bacterium]